MELSGLHRFLSTALKLGCYVWCNWFKIILMILSIVTQNSIGRAKLSSVFAEIFSDEGQADFAIINKAF